MRQTAQCWAFLALLHISRCADLAAVYKHGVLVLHDADAVDHHSSPQVQDLFLDLPEELHYPIGIAHDATHGRLFVADARHGDASILALHLHPNNTFKSLHTAVRAEYRSSWAEALAYDPLKENLYWTTPNNGIWGAHVPYDPTDVVDDELPHIVYNFTQKMEPRGIGLDYCNDLLYWSERGVHASRGIKMYDMEEQLLAEIRQYQENNKYYQGLTYDVNKEQIIWAETTGDYKSDSNCTFVSTTGVEDIGLTPLFSMENCYPFSITTDGRYVYWADWARQGIMRADLLDPSDIVKLLDAPQVYGHYGARFGVFGLTVLNHHDTAPMPHLCQDKSIVNNDDAVDKESEELEHDLKNIEVSLGDNKPKVDMVTTTAETAGHVGPETILPNIDDLTPRDNSPDQSMNQTPDQPMDQTTDQPMNQTTDQPMDQTTDQPMDKYSDLIENQSPSITQLPDAAHAEDHTGFERQERPGVQMLPIEDHNNPRNAESKSNPMNAQAYLIAIVVLGSCCLMFCTSTVALAVRMRRLPHACTHGDLPTTLPSESVPSKQPRQPKRFGPPKKLRGSPSCTQGSADGVHIQIEDCCQMTLCDTPCYTTVKKEGRGYKASSEDKKKLLDNCEF